MNRVKKFNRALLISLLSLYSVCSLALSTDRDQPINILADKLDIDDTQHISIYQGNVDMQQGTLHIQAEKIVFFFTAENDLIRLEIEGLPATLKQINDNNEPISGAARKIIYTDNLLLLKLFGDARFQSNADTIDSEWITINTNTDALKAGSIKGKNRVNMQIQPKNPVNIGKSQKK